ncbi:MAG: Maf family protein [Candidatus Cloacimonadaceae bacterium]|jgi:septum formation protein|nr:Maf family protein [Candidatus Cloacimonadota bacterium]MCB5258593.1 Maf family protein [Candidatus Cloacimonadota bacterium]MDD5625282.1 Maf family protein [Candidatus Cloacimonadota bacterium]MDY0111952.1 Maf family protein [Candidatus Syntrophosphaera sp.]
MIHNLLINKKVVLASSSPRRLELFRMIGLQPLVIPAQINEPINGDKPYLQAMNNAKNKASIIAAQMDSETIVVGADTIVVLNNKILGKPKNTFQAKEYLTLLSGKTHKVYTGVCICWKTLQCTRYERSLVEFAPLTEADIDAYVATGEPMDKAGAYGIQGYGSQFIKRIVGCYFNVMGFPIHLFYCMLSSMFESYTLNNNG